MVSPRELIQRKVPLLRDEPEHDWKPVTLTGCETCGGHKGFKCNNCQRCVDWELDTPLYEAILSTLPEEDIDD